jgi:hypothetical protein
MKRDGRLLALFVLVILAVYVLGCLAAGWLFRLVHR